MERRTTRIIRGAAWLALVASAIAASARAQDETTTRKTLTDQLQKVLTDPAEMEKVKKEETRPAFEFFKSTILPNDVIPYVKANHWSTMALELRANHFSYDGWIETEPGVPLLDMPHEVVFRRDARLVKGQRSRVLLQVMTPAIPKELPLQLIRPDALRYDDRYNAALRALLPHQMLIPVLTKGPNEGYARWAHLRSMYPLSGQKSDAMIYDAQRYYRMVPTNEPDRSYLPTHPLTWTTISHVVWDGMAPETLNVSQQDAMKDWLHWGGQLILVGGAGPNLAPFRESFLAPYLPAEIAGRGAQLSAEDLKAFAAAYPPLAANAEPEDAIEATQTLAQAFEEVGRRYKPAEPILVPKDKPLYVNVLDPKPGARVIGFGKPGLPPLGVEWRVGRGRILMLGVGLTDPVLLGWNGYDTFVRRVVLRRPEEPTLAELRYADPSTGLSGFQPPVYGPLNAPDLTWTRLLGRDLGAGSRRINIEEDETGATVLSSTNGGAATKTVAPSIASNTLAQAARLNPFHVPVGEWLDEAALPRMSRGALEHASGIEIPGRRFVLTVIAAYVIALVPINWLICRFGIRRREWAWAVVPLIAIGFAVVVERAAAYDVGYDSACNEVDVLETFGDYPRGHLSRFASLYTTGRVKYAISYPDDPSALALPMNTGRAIRGEDVQQSVFQTTPVPTLDRFQVQPRSLAMFRAEQYANLPGTFTLKEEGETRSVVNGTEAELRDAVVVDIGAKESRATYLGRVAPKGTVEVKGEASEVKDFAATSPEGLKKNEVDPAPFLEMLVKSSLAGRPEEEGEVRLVAWVASPRAGQTIEPAVDLHQGFTLVVAHLKVGPTPDPASRPYSILADGPERPSQHLLNAQPPPPAFTGMGRRMAPGRPGPSAPAIPGALSKGMIRAPRPAMPVAPTPGLPSRTKKAPATPTPGAPPGTPDPGEDDPDQPDAPGAPPR